MTIAVFDYSVWSARYPNLAVSVTQPLAASYFAEATLQLDNTDCSPVSDVGQRLLLLNMITAHIAVLNGASPAGAAGIVGRISEATEGDVTIKADLGDGIPAYWAQTPYGVAYFQATAGLRTMHYIPGPQPFFDAYPYGGFGNNRLGW
jgi:hypothetical protein